MHRHPSLSPGGAAHALRMRPWLALVALLVIVAGSLAAFASTARAHQDPATCTDTGLTISLAVFRNDETTVIGGGNFVQHGETIKYRATLSYAGEPNCAFEEGTLIITDPSGETHNVTPVDGIPQIGGTDGVNSVQSLFAEYEVAHDDELAAPPPRIQATVNYDDGIFHNAPTHVDEASGSTQITRIVAHDLILSKDADPTFDRDFDWTITKDVDPAVWNLFDGDTGTSDYEVVVTKDAGTDVNHAVTGDIVIENPNGFAVEIEDVTDEIAGVGAAVVVCPGGLPQALAANSTLTCSYSSDLPDDATRINTATITADAEQTGEVATELGGTATADIDFTGVEPTNLIDDEVDVSDTNPEGPDVTIDDDQTFNYSITFTCEGQNFVDGVASFSHPNTASLSTGDSDDANVDIDCYQLEVTKDIDGDADREWDWNVLKTADPETQTINQGESATVNWEIAVNLVDPNPSLSDVDISGSIFVENLNPDRDAIINDVADVFDGTTATVDCGAAFPITILAGDTLTCTYSGSAATVEELTNTATATQQNHDYDSSNVGTASGETDYQGTDTLTGGEVDITEIDFCVLVEDPDIDPALSETVCADDTLPATFNGSNTYAPETLVCGINEVQNTVNITEEDNTDQTDSSTAFATIEVICEEFEGCTPGFWRTHSSFAPGRQADLWVGLEADDKFNETFGVDWFDDDETLEDIMLQPGGLRTLGMHVIAAQLNINSDEVNYGLDQTELDAIIQAVDPNDPESVSNAIDILTEHNEAGCPDASEFEPTNENDNQPGPPAGRGPR